MTTTATARRIMEDGDAATALNLLHRRYEWNGDQMVCRGCKRAIHISRQHEAMQHGLNRKGGACDNRKDENPWLLFLDAANAFARSRPDDTAEAA